MQIAIIRPQCGGAGGGAERYCMMLCTGLVEAGHEVIFIGGYLDKRLREKVKFIRIPPTKGPSGWKNYSFHLKVQEALARFPGAVSYSLSRTFPVDIYRVTDPLHQYHLHLNYNTTIKKIWTRISLRHRLILRLEKRVASPDGSRYVVALSRLDRDLLKRLYHIEERRIRVIYNGVDMKKFSPWPEEERLRARRQININHEDTVYLFPAMDFRRKGLDILLRALAELEHPFTLLVAGKDNELPYRRLAKRLAIDSRIRFLGRRTDMARLYAVSDLMVLPTQYDPFGNVHLEALSCGLPVITTSQAGGAEVVRNGATGYVLHDRDSSEELANLLKTFQAQRRFWEKWRQKASESVRTFSLQENIRQNIELIRQVADEKGISA